MKKVNWHIFIEIILVAIIVTLLIYIRNSSPQQIQSESQLPNTVPHAVSQTDPALPSDYSSLMKYIDATADTPAIAKAVAVLRTNPEFKKKAIAEFSSRAEKTEGQERLKCVWVLGEFQDNDALKTGWNDYHWLRQDHRPNSWSHKAGETKAKNTDDTGDTVWDPEKAKIDGYDKFCGYLCVKKGATLD